MLERSAACAAATVVTTLAACGPAGPSRGDAADTAAGPAAAWTAPVRAAAAPLGACLAAPHPPRPPNHGAAWLPVCACAKAAAPALHPLACAAGPNFVAFLAPTGGDAVALAYAPDTAPAVFAGGTEHLQFDGGEVIYVGGRDPAPVAPWYRLELIPGAD